MSVPTHTQLVSAFRPQLPNAAHHQATGSGGGGGSDLTSTHRRVSYATQDVVLGTSPSIANAAVGDGGFKPGSIIGPGAGGEGAGVLQNIPLPSRGGGSGEDGDRVTLKKAPTLRAIQGVARKLGSLVGNNNSAAIGRLYLPCRTILPDTPCDILVSAKTYWSEALPFCGVGSCLAREAYSHDDLGAVQSCCLHIDVLSFCDPSHSLLLSTSTTRTSG